MYHRLRRTGIGPLSFIKTQAAPILQHYPPCTMFDGSIFRNSVDASGLSLLADDNTAS